MSYRVLELDPGMEAPGSARTALRGWLAEDGVAGLDQQVLLVASELVTNAAVHAGTAVQLSYAADQVNLEIGVHDGAPDGFHMPFASGAAIRTRAGSPVLAVSGRGLGIVGAVADEWGVTEEAGGKRVWARWSRSIRRAAWP